MQTDQLLILKDFAGDALLAPSAEAIKKEALKTAALIQKVDPNNTQQKEQAAAAMRILKDISKPVRAIGKLLRDEPNKLAKKIKLLEDTFVVDLEDEHDRIQGLYNHALEVERREEREREQEAELERLKAARAAQEAQAALLKAEQLKSAGQTQAAEAMEEAAMERALEAETATMAIVPVQSVKVAGVTVRERVNYQVIDWKEALKALPGYFQWDKDKELLKLCRRELLDFLNTAEQTAGVERNAVYDILKNRDKDGLPVIAGLRIYFEIKGHSR